MATDKPNDDKGKPKKDGIFDGTLSKILELTGTDISGVTKDFFNFNKAFISLENSASAVNRELLLTRSRIGEFKLTIADTAPLIAKLGGDAKQTFELIEDSTKSLGRNVIFEPEIYEKLFAAQTLLGKSAGTLITNFGEAGVMAAKIGTNVEKSLDYIRTIGVDAKNVMSNVVDNTGQLNRFSFKEGVLGFTKMAAQASILKVTMYDIEKFADKVFEPEGAIETAAAFQRLGVFMGDLADPFMLMNKSLNDPQGLMMSLAQAGERFTQFNEEAGRFEINPSAMNQITKLAEAAGMSAGDFKKMSLSLAEFNARASSIDIKYNLTDEQKMFIANLAYLDSDNEYKIKVTDEKTGETIATAVKDLTETQISKLDELSKIEPKTLEELARDTMTIQEMIRNDIGAIKYKLLFGAISEQSNLGRFQENLRLGISDVTEVMYKGVPGGESTRNMVRGVTNSGFDAIKGEDFLKSMTTMVQSIGSYFAEIPNNLSEGIKESKVIGSGFGTGVGLEALMDKLSVIGDLSDTLNKSFNIDRSFDSKAIEDALAKRDSLPKDFNNNLAVEVTINQKNQNNMNNITSTIKEIFKNSGLDDFAEKIKTSIDLDN